MSNPLPDPGIGRNPPRYQKTRFSWGVCMAMAVAAFLFAGGIYYVFSVNQIPTAADTGTAVGQGSNQR
jgi:hypothetical protein